MKNEFKNLFPNIDEIKTAKRVRYFFNNELVSYKRFASISLQSPSLNNESMGSSGNAIEDKQLKYTIANHIVQATNLAVEQCKPTHKNILEWCYFHNKNDYWIRDQIGYGKTSYFQLKKEALNEFADHFEQLAGSYYEDLHVYC